jgi:putative ABC transport system permease protein
MIKHNVRTAFASLRASRLRSALTMFGIVIGVASVVVVVGLGDGLRNQVTDQMTKLGSNLIIIQPGQKSAGGLSLTPSQNFGTGGVLTEQDLATVRKTADIQLVAPVASITGVPATENRSMEDALVVASNDALPTILGKKVPYGSFFGKDDQHKNYAIIGPGVAARLFAENVPIGRTLMIRGIEFIVQGVFEQAPVTPLSPSVNFNDAVVIPYEKAKEIGGGSQRINQILVTARSAKEVKAVTGSLEAALRTNHGGQHDFTVLSQTDALGLSDSVFSQLTVFVSSIAAISLLVSTIGIMNIMFATVSERTREIGIRKAVGATDRQIISQFLTEAVAVSVSGGLIGIVTALITIGVIRATSSYEPTINFTIIGIATGVSVVAGILAGILPAGKAAKKDPIESLR